MKRLETLCNVAEMESFLRPGEAVYLSQPTVNDCLVSREQTSRLRPVDLLGIRQVIVQGQNALERDFLAIIPEARDLCPLRAAFGSLFIF